MTHLRQVMLEELQRRNYAQNTAKTYIRIVRDFAKHYHTAPDLLGPDQIREYSAYLLESLPFPKRNRKLPEILSTHEMARLIDSASNLFHRAILMTLYSTGVRRAELCRLQVADIDSQRMIVHIRHGKGGHDRDVPLSEKLLETLRVYWRWMKPQTYLFPGTVKGWRADVPISDNVPWDACHEAAQRAAITKHV